MLVALATSSETNSSNSGPKALQFAQPRAQPWGVVLSRVLRPNGPMIRLALLKNSWPVGPKRKIVDLPSQGCALGWMNDGPAALNSLPFVSVFAAGATVLAAVVMLPQAE
jgi:hypothetical protein